MAKTRKRQISLAEYRSNPQAEKKNVKGYKPYKPSSNPKKSKKSELDIQLDKLSKIANTRLTALEKAKMRTSSYKSIERMALNGKSFMNIDKKGRPRFKRGTTKLSTVQKKAMKEALEKFLYQDKTSTIGGNKKARKNAKESFEENLGHKLSMEEYGTIIQMIHDITEKTNYSSDRVMDILSLGLDNGITFDNIEELIKDSSTRAYSDLEDLFDMIRNTVNVDDVVSGMEEDSFEWNTSSDWDSIF